MAQWQKKEKLSPILIFESQICLRKFFQNFKMYFCIINIVRSFSLIVYYYGMYQLYGLLY